MNRFVKITVFFFITVLSSILFKSLELSYCDFLNNGKSTVFTAGSIDLKFFLLTSFYSFLIALAIRFLFKINFFQGWFAAGLTLTPALLFPVIFKLNFIVNQKFADSNPIGFYKYIFGYIFISLLFSIFILFALLVYKSSFSNLKKCVSILLIIFFFHSGLSVWQSIIGEHGDEWLYLLLTKSIAADFDLNVKNNFDSQFHIDDGNLIFKSNGSGSQKIFIRYLPSYSLLISPGAVIAGWLKKFSAFDFLKKTVSGITDVYAGISSRILNIFWSVVFLFFGFMILSELFGTNEAVILTLFISISHPYGFYLNQLYPETISAGVKFLILYYLCFSNKIRSPFNLTFIVILSFVLFSLHGRNIVFFFFSNLLILCLNLKYKRLITLHFLILTFLIFCYFFYNYKIYDEIFPYKTFTGKVEVRNQENINIQNPENINSSPVISFKMFAKNFTGMFFDQKYGLFFYNPVMIFILTGAFILYRKNILLFIIIFSSFLVNLVFLASQNLSSWTGGSSIPNRYLVFLMPEMLFFTGFVFHSLKNRLPKFVFYACISYCLIIFFILNLFHRLRFSGGHHTNQLLHFIDKSIGLKFSEYLPFCNDIYSNSILYFYILIILLLNIWMLFSINKNEN
ncbi:MAG TPA: hypothetical protein PKY81_03200 [bacterium]|nr:hypothetical protein [bacterium]HPN29943.1 hypothetical protein [bacterium]